MARIVRKRNPPQYSRYQDYKSDLRLDFSNRCAYCTIHEFTWGGPRNFDVEHFRPKSIPRFRKLALVYTNLYYSCNRCNDFKGTKWPSPKQVKRGIGFIDPCKDSLTRHFRDRGDGCLDHFTPSGEFMVKQICLNREPLVLLRNRRREALREIRDVTKNLRAAVRQRAAGQGDSTILDRVIPQLERYIARLIEHNFRPPVPPT